MTTASYAAASIEADCNVAQDAVLALQLATGNGVALPSVTTTTTTTTATATATATVDAAKYLPSSLLDRLALMPHASISRFFNVSPGYTLPEYVEEDYMLAMYLRNALIVLALLAFIALALKLCCAHGYWHMAQRKYNERVPLDYRAQVAQLRAEQPKSSLAQ